MVQEDMFDMAPNHRSSNRASNRNLFPSSKDPSFHPRAHSMRRSRSSSFRKCVRHGPQQPRENHVQKPNVNHSRANRNIYDPGYLGVEWLVINLKCRKAWILYGCTIDFALAFAAMHPASARPTETRCDARRDKGDGRLELRVRTV
jgi:hypothetical protein